MNFSAPSYLTNWTCPGFTRFIQFCRPFLKQGQANLVKRTWTGSTFYTVRNTLLVTFPTIDILNVVNLVK